MLRTSGSKKLRVASLVLGATMVALAACGSNSAAGNNNNLLGKIRVVVAENFWGSIASQLGGNHVSVTSIISNPNTDPHAYEPSSQDARVIASAQYLVMNGAGYDPWVQKLVDANPVEGRIILDIGKLNRVLDGGNPHMWYSPTYVMKVIDQLTSDFQKIDAADSADFTVQKSSFENTSLAQYNGLRKSIKEKYSGTPVGATESIFVYLAHDLGLDLITPAEYMKAISEGNGPTAQDKATFDSQISNKRIKLLIFNSQNTTPDIQTLVDKAKSQQIPVTSVTETLIPATATFQAWQSSQLEALQKALALENRS